MLPDERARQGAVARLAEDPRIEASGSEVIVLSGVLRLSGRVPNETMRTQAAELCAAIAGVTSVENELSLP